MYGDTPIPIFLPENWDVHISEIAGFNTPALNEQEIAKAIAEPIGTKPISEAAKGCKSAVIIIDDITRPTPCEPIANALLKELKQAGVPKENIWFIAALGTHGPMYHEHFVRKLGEKLVQEYEVHNHNVFFNHVFLGNTSHYVPVEINADVMQADFKIAIGTAMAHSYFGFGGGAKCILPGVSSMRTITANHSFTTPSDFNMGNPNSLMRNDAEEAARMMRLNFKVDSIINGHGQICKLFAGDFAAEAEQCRLYAAEHYKAKFVPDCDVVISNSYLKPAEASCAYTPEVLASLKDGGDFVLSANSPLGSCIHYLYDKWGKTSPGGKMWAGCYTKTSKMNQAIVFAQHSTKGSRDPWYIDENSGATYLQDWNDVIKRLDDGTPKKAVIYPMAEAQILDNSSSFYKKQ
jgi:nickel-dependent lactate racemase